MAVKVEDEFTKWVYVPIASADVMADDPGSWAKNRACFQTCAWFGNNAVETGDHEELPRRNALRNDDLIKKIFGYCPGGFAWG